MLYDSSLLWITLLLDFFTWSFFRHLSYILSFLKCLILIWQFLAEIFFQCITHCQQKLNIFGKQVWKKPTDFEFNTSGHRLEVHFIVPSAQRSPSLSLSIGKDASIMRLVDAKSCTNLPNEYFIFPEIFRSVGSSLCTWGASVINQKPTWNGFESFFLSVFY